MHSTISIVVIVFLAQMRQLLNMYGVRYTQVTLQSVYITSVAVTFEIRLPTDTSAQNVEPLRAFGDFFTNDFQSLGVFVVRNGSRGTLQVIPTGKYKCIKVHMYTFGSI